LTRGWANETLGEFQRADDDFNAALDERDRVRPRPSLRSQVITTIKVFTAGGVIVLALWVIDLIVTD